MKLTAKQLRKIIREVAHTPAEDRSDSIEKAKNTFFHTFVRAMKDAYDPGDPSMTDEDMWHQQCDMAGEALDILLSDAVLEVEEKLFDGEYFDHHI